MRDLDAGDRPREKLEASGAATLGDNELIALLVGHGRVGENALDVANALLDIVGTVQGLTRIDRRQLLRVPGVGPVVAARILAGVEVGRRTLVREAPAREQFLHAAQVAGYLLPRYGAHPEERFGVMTLDARYRLLRAGIISVGTLNITAAYPRAVFREAALVNAAAVVVFHNHPSGDPQPSVPDIELTQRLVDAGHLLDIPVIDHLIPRRQSLLLNAHTEGHSMGRVMYVDGCSGAAGDMLLGALLDAGLPESALRSALGSLGVDHALLVTRVLRAGVSALHVEVTGRAGAERMGVVTGAHGHPDGREHTHGHAHSHVQDAHRSLAEIAQLIDTSALSPAGKVRAKTLFARLGAAEAAIHQVPLEEVHLHEVGATDSIIDIVGVVFAMEWFGIDDVVAAPLNVGGGVVRISHGTYPVPAPATLKLLTGVPIYNGGPDMELVTPTGALLVTGYARAFGPMPRMAVTDVGYGAGTRDHPARPNVLRVLVGDRVDAAGTAASAGGAGAGSVVQVDCEIDDMNPQLVPEVTDRLLDAGALDVFATPVVMKKGRPGTLLTVLATSDRREAITTVLFRETTTIGVRFHEVDREVLDRHWVEVTLPGGVVRVKVAGRDGAVLNVAPEFDDCARVARVSQQPVKAVQAAALRAWHEAMSGPPDGTR